tara:strand:+ start:492 stop:1013 length:522 start_codon:yes stop_codon:yes gene_type:complete
MNTNDGDAKRDWQTLAMVLLMLILCIFVANVHLEVRGEVSNVDIGMRFFHSAIVSFMLTTGMLFTFTLAFAHRQARITEQALGMFLTTVVAALIYGWAIDSGMLLPGVVNDIWSQFSTTVLRLLVVECAGWIALGICFGLLLAMVSGREYADDPLLELNSEDFTAVENDDSAE